MKQTELEELLRDITLSAIAKNANGEDDVSNLLFEIDAAVKSRRTVDCVQFEEAWKDVVDGSKQPYLFINFKLSSDVCAVAYGEGEEVNELTWNLVLPFINGVDADELPDSGFDWLEKGEIHIGNESIEAFHCLKDLIQMDAE
jgi:hypothetical protein